MRYLIPAALTAGLLFPTQAFARWSLNLGYQNPSSSTVGLNVIRFGQRFAFEFGVGWLDLKTLSEDDRTIQGEGDEEERVRLAVGGDIDLKYLFGRGTTRPYLQGGVGVGVSSVASNRSDLSITTGEGFAGIGFFYFMGFPYLYLSLNRSAGERTFLQAGLGF